MDVAQDLGVVRTIWRKQGRVHVVDLALLSGLEVAVVAAVEEVAADAALVVGPEGAGVHHLPDEERLWRA